MTTDNPNAEMVNILTGSINHLISIVTELLDRKRITDFENELWNTEDIALYLRKKKRTVMNYVVLPTFPVAVMLPSRTGENGRNTPKLYFAKEVVAWAKMYRGGSTAVSEGKRRRGRPRSC